MRSIYHCSYSSLQSLFPPSNVCDQRLLVYLNAFLPHQAQTAWHAPMHTNPSSPEDFRLQTSRARSVASSVCSVGHNMLFMSLGVTERTNICPQIPVIAQVYQRQSRFCSRKQDGAGAAAGREVGDKGWERPGLFVWHAVHWASFQLKQTNKNLLKICVKQAFSLIDTPSCRSIRVFPAVVCYGSLKRTNHRLVIAQAATRLLWEHLKI